MGLSLVQKTARESSEDDNVPKNRERQEVSGAISCAFDWGTGELTAVSTVEAIDKQGRRKR